MKRPPTRTVLATLLAAMTFFATTQDASASAWNDCQINALTGVKKVTIILLSGGDGVKRLGFDQEKARNDIAAQLQKAGIAVEPYGSIKDKPDTAALQVETHLTVIQSTDGKPLGLTYAIDSYIMDPVVSARRQMPTPVLGVVWKSRGQHGYVNGQNLHKFTHKITDVVSEFIADWQTANKADIAENTAGIQAPGTPSPTAASQPPSDAINQQQELIRQQQAIIAQQQAELQKLLEKAHSSAGAKQTASQAGAPGTK